MKNLPIEIIKYILDIKWKNAKRERFRLTKLWLEENLFFNKPLTHNPRYVSRYSPWVYSLLNFDFSDQSMSLDNISEEIDFLSQRPRLE